MLKVIGSVFTMSGSIGISFLYCTDLQKSIQETRCLIEIIDLLKSEIQYQKAPLPEAVLEVAQKVESPYRETLLSIGNQSIERRKEFPGCWKVEFEKLLSTLHIPEKGKHDFLQIMKENSFSDIMMQIHILEQKEKEMKESLEQQKSNIHNRGKVAMSLGIAVGVIFTILLL